MKKFAFAWIAVLLLLAGCSKSKDVVDDHPQPTPSNPTIELANEALKSLTFPAEGGEQTVAFTVSAAWQASAADGSWCAVSPASGAAGQATFKVTVPPTGQTEVRTTTVTIQAGATALPISVKQEGGVQELSFPDPNFKKYLLENFDTDKDGKITQEEALKVTRMSIGGSSNVPEEQIASLEGIQYFTNLTYLFCDNNQLTSLDVSKNTALTELYCGFNPLMHLDASGCIALTKLDCIYNQLTRLDVSGCAALATLNCFHNQLPSLDVSGCTALTKLSCYDNKLTGLDVSNNTVLTVLGCWSNQLTSLDVSKNTVLTELHCGSNQLTSLDVSKNTALTELSCYFNQLTSLDVSKNTALTELNCNSNQLTSLDVSNNTALTELSCRGNQLTNLDVSNNTALAELDCSANQLTILDVSKTNLGNSTSSHPLFCTFMNTLEFLYLKSGWSIPGITEDNGRSDGYIPEQTKIVYVD